MARGREGTVYLTQQGPVFELRRAIGPKADHRGEGRLPRDPLAVDPARMKVVRLALTVAGGRTAPLVGESKLPGKVSYLRGDRSRWRRGVPTYGRVRAAGVYPGIDMVYYGLGSQLEYDFVVAPGAKPEQVRLRAEGVRSARLADNGDLLLETELGTVTQGRPVAYQQVDGRRVTVTAEYDLRAMKGGESEVRFKLGAFDPARPLVIDPTLSYSTLLGGTDFDSGEKVAVDGTGASYVVGGTFSNDFPASGSAFDRTFNGFPIDYTRDVFVAKFNAAGSQLIYATYLGGRNDDIGLGIAVDGAGSAFVTGRTFSTEYPTTPGVVRRTIAGDGDVFVTKLSPNGSSLVYSTLVGGADDDRGRDIRVDADGNAYVTGGTNSIGFPVVNAVQPDKASVFDAFLFQLNPTGTALDFSTFLGGDGFDEAWGVARDINGRLYVGGSTDSLNLPVLNPAQLRPGSLALTDAFVACYLPTGARVYTTYLGGNDEDYALAIAVDTLGRAMVTGVTFSTNFPRVSPYQNAIRGDADAFFTSVAADGSAWNYSTYLGGRSEDYGNAIASDPSGAATIGGETLSNNFPLQEAFQSTYGGEGPDGYGDGFVTRFQPNGQSLVYSSYLGGNGDDYVTGIITDRSGAVYLTGQTSSSNFKTTPGSYDRSLSGPGDAFIAKIGGRSLPPSSPTNLTATVSGNLVTLRWTDTSDNESGFKVERRVTGGTFGVIHTTGEDAVTYTDGTGTPNTTYEYRIRATNGAGDSLASNIVSARPQGTPGSGLTATPASVAFGSLQVRKRRSRTVVLENTTGIPIVGTLVAPSRPFVITAGGGGLTLGPRESRTITIQFRPTKKRPASGALTVTGAGGVTLVTVRLTGRGR